MLDFFFGVLELALLDTTSTMSSSSSTNTTSCVVTAAAAAAEEDELLGTEVVVDDDGTLFEEEEDDDVVAVFFKNSGCTGNAGAAAVAFVVDAFPFRRSPPSSSLSKDDADRWLICDAIGSFPMFSC